MYKHFFSRPRLLRYSKSGEITDSRGHGFQSENGFELGLLQSSNTAKIEPVGVMDVHKQMEEENSEVFAKRGLL